MIKAYATSMMLRITPTASNNVIHREKSKKWCNMQDMTTNAIVNGTR